MGTSYSKPRAGRVTTTPSSYALSLLPRRYSSPRVATLSLRRVDLPKELRIVVAEYLDARALLRLEVVNITTKKIVNITMKRRVLAARSDLAGSFGALTSAQWKHGAVLMEPRSRVPIYLLSGGFRYIV